MKINNKSLYRADIDGLRAIAIALVVFYHANYTLFSGGFIGVDVFFVISGYFITAIIYRGIETGRFSYWEFYLRRIRRIIPVLVFVLIATSVIASILLFPDDLEKHARISLHALFSTSNFYLWIKGSNYFTDDTSLIPLLHIWSLAVEEQFYFIWPTCLIIATSFIKKEKLPLYFFIFFILFLFISIWMSNHSSLAAYFLLPARAFELLIGAGLALFWRYIPDFSKATNHFLSLTGLLLIISAAITLTKEVVFPGLNAFWPCLGAALLLISGKNTTKQGIVNTFLCLKPVVFVGLISYSLYLWHWPIFVFITYVGVELTGAIRLIAISGTVILSYLSWKYIEIVYHYRYKWSFKLTMRRIVIPSFVVIITLYAIIDGNDGFPIRFSALPEFDKDRNAPNRVRKACFDKYLVGNVEACALGIKKERLDGLLIGDSFGNHTAAILDVLAKDASLFIHDSTAGGFPLLKTLTDKNSLFSSNTLDYGDKRLAYAKQFNNIFIAANWQLYETPGNINYEPILKSIGDLVENGINVFVFSDIHPTTTFNLHRYKLFKTREDKLFKNYDFNFSRRARPDTYIISEMKHRYPSVIIINPNNVLCNDKTCRIEIEGSLLYRNASHLNTSGGKLIGEKYIEQFGNPLLSLEPRL